MKKILIGNFKGPPGVQGRSAYQVAVNEGYVGSEAQWIESLHSIVPGPKGETGIQGYQGVSVTGLGFNADGSISVSIHDPKTNTDSTIAAGNALTSSLLAQMQQYVNNAGSSANAAAASQSAAKMSESNSALSAENASMSATASANSAASAAASAEAAKAISQGSVGFYTTSASLEAAHPIGKDGNWAIIGKTDTIWVWDGDLSIWKDTGEKTDLSNYYTKTQANSTFVGVNAQAADSKKLGNQLPEYYAAASDVLQADAGIRGLTATVEASATASQAYATGAYFVYNGLLYKCTVAIAQGGTITPGTNCTATTAGAEIYTLNQNLTPVLLWTNPAPTAEFGPQTITLDMSSFSRVRIYGGERTSPINFELGGRLYFEADMEDYSCMIFGQSGLTSRALKITTSGIKFGDGQFLGIQNGALTVLSKNSLAIPLKIYGIK